MSQSTSKPSLSGLHVHYIGSIAIIELTAEDFGSASLNAADVAMQNAAATVASGDLVLDCSQLTLLSTAAMGSILRLHRRLETDHRRVVLAGVGPTVMEQLESIKLAGFLTITKTLPEALAMLEQPTSQQAGG